uniref:Secreted protein n=1 Tax=Rhizophora mucronata TaxID=61149 RepID=A0A2P2LTS2_RHIMU
MQKRNTTPTVTKICFCTFIFMSLHLSPSQACGACVCVNRHTVHCSLNYTGLFSKGDENQNTKDQSNIVGRCAKT